MTQTVHRLTRSSRAGRVPVASLIAVCLVVLQLVTALHFALVPHGFSAGLNGFVHVHEVNAARPAAPATLAASPTPALVSSSLACAPDSCPMGFAGLHSVLLAAASLTGLLELGPAQQSACSPRLTFARRSVLRSAPKTSPPNFA